MSEISWLGWGWAQWGLLSLSYFSIIIWRHGPPSALGSLRGTYFHHLTGQPRVEGLGFYKSGASGWKDVRTEPSGTTPTDPPSTLFPSCSAERAGKG